MQQHAIMATSITMTQYARKLSIITIGKSLGLHCKNAHHTLLQNDHINTQKQCDKLTAD